MGPTSTLDAVTYPLSISVEEGLTGDASGPEIVVLGSTSGVLTNTVILLYLHFCLLSWQVDPGLDINTIFSIGEIPFSFVLPKEKSIFHLAHPWP